MAKSFPGDFYVTCATVIPVLFLAMVVQGGPHEAMLRTARAAARKLPKRQRDLAAAELLPTAAYIALIAGLLGEVISVLCLFNGSDTRPERTIVLVSTFVLLVAVAAGPAWKWWQVQAAISRQRLRPGRATGEDPDFGYGAGNRPLWTTRDMDAERIRVALRDAGCPEFGEPRGGFVVEGGNDLYPFYVACTTDDSSRRTTELKTYAEVLTAAGFRTEQDPGLDGVLVVRDTSSSKP